MFRLKMISYHQAQLQEYKMGCTVQMYSGLRHQSLQATSYIQCEDTECLKCIIRSLQHTENIQQDNKTLRGYATLIKVISASGACFSQFKNPKRKLYKYYANIYFTYIIRFYLIFLKFYKIKTIHCRHNVSFTLYVYFSLKRLRSQS